MSGESQVYGRSSVAREVATSDHVRRAASAPQPWDVSSFGRRDRRLVLTVLPAPKDPEHNEPDQLFMRRPLGAAAQNSVW